jgi:beta-glucosidase
MEVLRDPRMGRNEEAYTEDPYLYMRIGETIVRATQGTDISAPDKSVAVLTDFPSQSGPASGLERGAIELSERSLRENFMPPWIGAITKAGGLGVIAGYPEVEHVPAPASKKWTNDILRGRSVSAAWWRVKAMGLRHCNTNISFLRKKRPACWG